jgi:putative oxidoreductase
MTGLDAGLFVLRLALGTIYIAHGLRKLGWRSPGGFAGFRSSIARRGFRVPQVWAGAAVGAEVVGGALGILGLLTPVAAALLLAQSVTIVALVRGRGFWVEAMGIEYPLLLGVVALVIGLAGPGSLSLDAALGLEVHWWWFVGLGAVTVAGSIFGLVTRRPQPGP